MTTEKTKVYLVNHTHWDREWYFSSQDSVILSDLLFTNAIKELQQHPEASFTLDGQLSILDDYVTIHPEMRMTIQQLVANKQLQIGPWYTQPDALHLQGESLLRNGMLGQLSAMKYGQRLPVGYLPDTFGFNSQLPVVLNELGLHSFVFWRGIDPKKTHGFYFKWHSLGGQRTVTAVNMPQGYGTGMLLTPSHDYVDQRLDPAVDLITQISPQSAKVVLIPTGNDQMEIIHDFTDKVAKINQMGKYEYEVSDYPGFIAKLNPTDLADYTGEFLDPIYARVHRTCGSSRMDIKLAATKLEDKLIYQVEPLMVIGQRCGIDLSSGDLVLAWQKLLESQAHDSMAGSIVDSVAADILQRLKSGHELADSLINTIERLIALNLGLTDQQVLLLNPALTTTDAYQTVKVTTASPDVYFKDVEHAVLQDQTKVASRENVLSQTASGDHYITEPAYYLSTYQLKTTLPPLGYRVIDFEATVATTNRLQLIATQTISNDQLEIAFNDGSLTATLFDGTVLSDFLTLQDQGNAGDTYDFSPLAGDQPQALRFQTATVKANQDWQLMQLTGQLKLPKNLTERKNTQATVMFKYHVDLILTANHNLTAKLHVDNNIADHKLSLVVNTGSSVPAVASVPFGFLTRDRQEPEQWQDRYAERPVAIWPLDHSVSVNGATHTITAMTSDVKEYEQQGDQLWLTLLATTDQLGKPDLINRPGRASGDTTKLGHPFFPTPQAELQQAFDYQVTIRIDDRFDELVIAQQALQVSQTALAYQSQQLNLFINRLDNKLQDELAPKAPLPATMSLFELPEHVVAGACYPDFFDHDAVIVRVVNPTKHAVEFALPTGAQVVNAIDEAQDYQGTIASYDVLTLKFNKAVFK